MVGPLVVLEQKHTDTHDRKEHFGITFSPNVTEYEDIVASHLRRVFANSMAVGQYNGNGVYG